MEEREQEKIKKDAAGSAESLLAVHESCRPPDMKSMSPEEARAYLDDLFFGNLLSEG